MDQVAENRVSRSLGSWGYLAITACLFVSLVVGVVLLVSPSVESEAKVNQSQEAPTTGSRVVLYCRITFGTMDGSSNAEFRIRDPELIEQLVLRPLREAIVASDKEGLLGCASLRFHYSDGSEDGVALGMPWGHFLSNEGHRIAKLGPLADKIKADFERRAQVFSE